jgi:hypothetical protein
MPDNERYEPIRLLGPVVLYAVVDRCWLDSSKRLHGEAMINHQRIAVLKYDNQEAF